VVLLVEDNPGNLTALEMLLSQAGFRLVSTANAEAALTRLKQQVPRCAVIDHVMPDGMSGLDLLKHMRIDPATKGVPAILITAMSDGDVEALRQEALPYGPVSVMQKPIEPKMLVAAVEAMAGVKLPETNGGDMGVKA